MAVLMGKASMPIVTTDVVPGDDLVRVPVDGRPGAFVKMRQSEIKKRDLQGAAVQVPAGPLSAGSDEADEAVLVDGVGYEEDDEMKDEEEAKEKEEPKGRTGKDKRRRPRGDKSS
jgi:hypothetical protein